MIRGVIFDLDDTLIKNSVPFSSINQDIKKFMAAHGVSQGFLDSMGKTLEGIHRLKELDATLGAAAEEELVRLEMERAKSASIPQESLDCLNELKARGIKIGIATRNCRLVAMKLLEPVSSLVDTVVARDDVSHVKPNPEHILTAVRNLGLEAGECVCVGDYIFDVQASRFAGCISVGLGIQGDYTITTLKELPALIDSIRSSRRD